MRISDDKIVIEPDDLPLLLRWADDRRSRYHAILAHAETILREQGDDELADVLAREVAA